jgi:hypothetical protein
MRRSFQDYSVLAALTTAAVFVHGYHLGGDDAAIYVPAIKKAADPSLFPDRTEFFMSHASLSLFPNLIGGVARLTHVPIDWVLFLFHIFSIFLLLLAARRLACLCFRNEPARWGAVALLAGVLTIPVAGTALLLMDPNITARSLSTPLILLAVERFMRARYGMAFLFLLFTLVIHPHMIIFAVVLFGFVGLARNVQVRALGDAVPATVALAAFPISFELAPAHGVYLDILHSRSYFFVSSWQWYEWLGVVAPLAILWWLARAELRGTTAEFSWMCRTLFGFGIAFTVLAVLMSIPEKLQNLGRLQPMRSFHVLYAISFILLGGLLGEYVLRTVRWRWVTLFSALSVGMWVGQMEAFPSSPHVEWPGVSYRSSWMKAFLWIRGNTPKDAFFALDPDYFRSAGEDEHGFRAVAERNALADNLKDSGAVSVFPQLAGIWKGQVDAERGWDHFHLNDFQRLAKAQGVNWVVLKRPAISGLSCPYRNENLEVCRVSRN